MYGTSNPTTGKQTQETDALLSARPPSLKRAPSRRKPFKKDNNRSVLDKVFTSPESSSRLSKGNKNSSKSNNPSSNQSEVRQSMLSYSFVYSMLNPRSKQWQAVAFKSFISTVIIADLCLFIISTDEIFAETYFNYLYGIEGLVSCIFLVEYVARLVTVTERIRYGKLGPIRGRLAYMITPGAVIDAFATLPFFIEICTGWNLPTLTYLRFFRLFRILKTEGYVRAIDAVYRVIYYNRQILYVALLVCCFLVLLTAVLLYYLRPPPEDDPDNADSFSSILATLYLSTLMLTGQGGPEGDLPWYTKAVVLLTSLFSVAMFAIPASMLTWGFEAEAERCAKLSWRRANKPTDSSSSSSYSSDEDGNSSGHSTDEEYFKIIAGEGEEEGESEATKAWMKAQKLSFQKADTDNSGSISMREYLQMQSARKNSDDEAAAAAGGSSTTGIISRLQFEVLENKVNDNSKKLNRILKILEQNN